jgi:carbamoyl-phosphate synthase large subunit
MPLPAPLAHTRDDHRRQEQTQKLALALNVVGLMNVQYAVKGREIYILEVNPRASRTVPFVAKVIGKPIAAIAARIMAGEKLASFDLKLERLDHVGVKEAVFPFARFPGVDTVLGPEMRSTGEVMGIDRSFEIAFAKSQLGAGSRPPTSGAVFVSVRDADKEKIVEPLRKLQALGFKILATGGTQRYLTAHGLKAEKVNKVSEGRPHAADAVRNGARATHVQHHRGRHLACRFLNLRRAALLQKTPYHTTISGAIAAADGIRAVASGELEVRVAGLSGVTAQKTPSRAFYG